MPSTKPLIALAVSLALLSGCQTAGKSVADIQAEDAFVANKPVVLQPYFRRLYEEGERNAVLNFNRLGLAALETGEYEISKKAFDESIRRIETIYANNPEAEKARSVWNGETVKDFKGEPYERSMTYYYRGLLYIHASDFDNARAAFLAANLQDQWAEDQQYASDFGVMEFLAGWSSMCIGDRSSARERFDYALKQQPEHAFDTLAKNPPLHLHIVESGFGPGKSRSGKYGEILTFSDSGNSPQPHPKFASVADIYFQATTRGGRGIDRINKGKAEFKDNANTTSDIASAVAMAGAMTSLSGAANYDSQQMDIGNSMAALGFLTQVGADIVSRNTTPEADIRYWESLPRDIYIAPAHASTGTDTALKASGGACTLTWEKQNPSSIAAGAGNFDPKVDNHKSRILRNQKFRNDLSSLF